MSQEEICELLKEKEMTMREIADELNLSVVAVWKNLNSMRKAKEIEKDIQTKKWKLTIKIKK